VKNEIERCVGDEVAGNSRCRVKNGQAEEEGQNRGRRGEEEQQSGKERIILVFVNESTLSK
jgi:hypothetical protein